MRFLLRKVFDDFSWSFNTL